tara:strand:+ start:6574 stop:6819 length:246 start_codon:yes stop_codon:yes gene_type:complete
MKYIILNTKAVTLCAALLVVIQHNQQIKRRRAAQTARANKQEFLELIFSLGVKEGQIIEKNRAEAFKNGVILLEDHSKKGA